MDTESVDRAGDGARDGGLQYADLLVDTCVGIQPGWQVLVLGSPPGRPLLEALGRAIARRGAYAVFQLSIRGQLGAGDTAWLVRPLIDSYHTVWFELHEELIRATGMTREEAARSDEAQ